MKKLYLSVSDLKNAKENLKVGDRVFLSGTVYTARDAAHKRIFELIDDGKALPFPIIDSVIYYAGPTPTPNGKAIGSCGPTTSARMDPYTPSLYEKGLLATVGKGERNQAVIDAIKKHKTVYFCALGGAGALASACITSAEVIAFQDLGCESVKRLTFHDFPLTVAIDTNGDSIFEH